MLVGPLLERREQILQFDIEKDVPELFQGDFTRLKQAICNLLSNAIKFTEPGGLIILRCFINEKTEIAFSVKDQVIGIAEHEINELFQAFQQGSNAEKIPFKGTGLGLAVTRGIIELHNGRVEAQSILGEGSEFTIFLPLSFD